MCTFKLIQDIYPDDPRENFNLGVMICFHGRYELGDKHSYNYKDFSGWEDLQKQLIKDYQSNIVLPLYLYDHSGITISTTPFSCRWDSGQVGFIIADIQKVKEALGYKRITKHREEKLLSCLRGEVETYDKYLTGDVWGYEIYDEDGNQLDFEYGFYGIEHAEQEASSAIKNIK
jgi:hypothetical protein